MDEDWEEERTRRWDAAEDDYRIFRDAFESEQTSSLVRAVQRRSNELILRFRTKIDSAKSGYELFTRNVEGPRQGWVNPLIVSVLRSYRAVEWFHAELSRAVIDAMSEPFLHYIDTDKPVRIGEFFRHVFTRALRDATIEKAFEPEHFADRFEAFYKSHSNVRNNLSHTLYVPSRQEAYDILVIRVPASELGNRRPASYSHKMATICASVKRLLRMSGPPRMPGWAEIHSYPWLPIQGLSQNNLRRTPRWPLFSSR